MDYTSYFQSVKEKRFESVYLFTGPEEYAKKEALNALRGAILPEGLEELNDSTLEDCTAQSIIDTAETLPFMSEKRIVCIRDWGPLTTGKVRNESEEEQRLLEWLPSVPDTAVLVFYMVKEVSASKKLYTYLSRLPGFVKFDYLTGNTLARWCAERLKPYRKKLDPEAQELLVDMAGQDLTRLLGELTKLVDYTQDAPVIMPADVQATVSPSPDYSIFLVLDHLLEGRAKEAFEVVATLMQGDMNPVRLISTLTTQLRTDTFIKYAMEDSTRLPEALKTLNVREARSRFIIRQIKPIPAAELESRYRACLQAEYDIKSGQLQDKAVLNQLLYRLLIPRRNSPRSGAPGKR